MTPVAVPTRGPLMTGVSIACAAVAVPLVTFRCYAAFKGRGFLGIEEWCTLASFIFLIIITVLANESVMYGFGEHMTQIASAGGNVADALKFFYLFQIFYKLAICFNKLAILLLYFRVFHTAGFRTFCLAMIAIVCTGTLAFVIATVVECLPLKRNWDTKMPGHCINNTAFRWSWAAFNTATDLIIVAMPMPIIKRLKMDPMKKIGLVLIFSLGLFICATSAIRMEALVSSTTGKDSTWDSLPAFVWSVVEAAVGLYCACLPSLKAPLSKLIPKSWIQRTTSFKYGSSEHKLSRLSGHKHFSAMDPSGQGNARAYGEHIGTAVTSNSRDSQERIFDKSINVNRDITVEVETLSDEESSTERKKPSVYGF